MHPFRRRPTTSPPASGAGLARGITVAVAVPATIAAIGAAAPAHASTARHEPSRTHTVPRTTPTPAAWAGPGTTATHTVVRGETLWAIARRYGTTVDDLLRGNGLAGTVIHPGQVLLVRAGVHGSPTPSTLPQAAAPEASAPRAASVVVRAGDTLTSIARAHGVRASDLMAWNGIPAGAILYPGHELRLTPPAAGRAPVGPQKRASLNAAQRENARMIIRIGRELGISDRGIAIALGTAMVESWVRNLDGGDRDSLGLFQQRPSQGWGAPADLNDRAYAIRAFFLGVDGPDGPATRGLSDISDWESLDFANAAQAVQNSAHPDRYAAWEQASYAWLAELG